MSSIIEGYNYDIFISYRQKDNKGDRWVSNFVDALKTELEATFKEDVSVYFDENPHDRLQETHNVDKSLEDKLKCLIFIPILSQTYCDPKSYAWQYEFLPFLKMAGDDRLGKDIKLRNGNVASRILPVRIHDLEPEDVKLFEKETGSVLRALDFVFRTSTGVSRTLKANEDHPQDNLNKTFYSDQINKVGHAIKEIIFGIKAKSARVVKEKKQSEESFKKASEDVRQIHLEKPTKIFKVKFLSIPAVVALLIVAAIFVYPKIFKQDALEKMRSSGEKISVAVMPFQNITNDTTRNIWQRWIQYNLINTLSNAEQLMVRQPESIEYLIRNTDISNTALTPALARSISKKLDSDICIRGTIGQAGSSVRVYVQLLDSKTEQVLKSFQVEGPASEDNVFIISDSLSTMVRDYMVISGIKQSTSANLQLPLVTTNSPEAFNNFTSGSAAFTRLDYNTSIEFYKRALEADKDFTMAAIMLTWSYMNLGQYQNAMECHMKAYEKSDRLSLHIKTKLLDQHAYMFEGPRGRIKSLDRLKNLDDQDPWTYYDLGYSYNLLGQYNKAIPEFEKALDLFDKWDLRPSWAPNYTQLGYAYHQTGQHGKEEKLYRRAEKDFPDDYLLLYRQAILALSMGNNKATDEYIAQYVSALEKRSYSEADIASNLGGIYREAGMLQKAEELYREALSLQPGNATRLNNLAVILIDNDINIGEGLELAEKALEIEPDNFRYLGTKGWGFYKQGKFEEALEYLERSWELKPIFNHTLYLHLEAVKKAISGYKNN